MPNEANNSQRLYLQIADKLAQTIKNNEVGTGDRLPSERELSSRFNVSRQTVREALIALEVAGVVDIRLGSGVYVKTSSNQSTQQTLEDAPSPIEILEARKIFESQAASLAATRVTSKDIEDMEQIIREMLDFEKDKNIIAAEDADMRFHLAIAKASRNSVIYHTINWLWELRSKSKISQFYDDKVRTKGSQPDIKAHQLILDSLRRKDPSTAYSAMTLHLDTVQREFSEFSLDSD